MKTEKLDDLIKKLKADEISQDQREEDLDKFEQWLKIESEHQRMKWGSSSDQYLAWLKSNPKPNFTPKG